MKALIPVMATVCLTSASLAQRPSSLPKPAPELKDWEVWVGDWTMVGTAKDGPTEPEYKVDWCLHGRWILGGFFVQVDHIWRGKGPEQHSVEILSYDPIKKIHTFSGFADDGTTWTATATFDKDTSVETGTDILPGGKVATWSNTVIFSADRMAASARQEKVQDGIRWTASTFKGTKVNAAPAADLAAEQAAIRALFERHRRAIESKDLAGVSQTFDRTGPLAVAIGEGEPMTDWPSVEQIYRDWFAAADEIRMKDTCLQIRVHPSGLAAWATYLTDETEVTKSARRTAHLRATFGLEKHGSTWVVVQAHWSVPLRPRAKSVGAPRPIPTGKERRHEDTEDTHRNRLPRDASERSSFGGRFPVSL